MNLIISLKHAISASCGWENNYRHKWNSEAPPEFPTFLGAACHELRPAHMHDTWRFFVVFQFGSRVTEKFYGSRARGLWKEWKAMQFSKLRIKPKRKKKNGNPDTTIATHTDTTAQLALI